MSDLDFFLVLLPSVLWAGALGYIIGWRRGALRERARVKKT